jgi:hypothetical protein
MKINFKSLLANTVSIQFFLALTILINKSSQTIEQIYDASDKTRPLVIFLAPKNTLSEHQLNERNSLTNKLEKGWVLKSGEQHDFIVQLLLLNEYNLVNEDEISSIQIFFTNSETECNFDSNDDNDKQYYSSNYDVDNNPNVFKVSFSNQLDSADSNYIGVNHFFLI